MKQKYEKRDVHEEITNRLIEFIEKHDCLPFQREWDTSKCDAPLRPHNPVTGTKYRGVNLLSLACSDEAFETGDYRFVTFAQAVKNDWHVKKGSKSLPVIYYEPSTSKEESDSGEAASEDRPSNRFSGILKSYRVFHASCVDGIPAYELPHREAVTWTVPRGVEAIINNFAVPVIEGGDKAFYSPIADRVHMPPRHAFTGDSDDVKAASHASTILHELSHAAEDPRRLDLAKRSRFGTPDYARGELRVEIAAIFLCSEYSLPTKFENQASYIAGWLKALKNDKNEVGNASRDAQKIFDYLIKFDPDYAATLEPEEAPKPLDQVLPASAMQAGSASLARFAP